MMDITKILEIAGKDREIKSALYLLRDILFMSKEKGQCFISAGYFQEKYSVSRATFFRHKKLLADKGYIKSEEYFKVSVSFSDFGFKNETKKELTLTKNETLESQKSIENNKNETISLKSATHKQKNKGINIKQNGSGTQKKIKHGADANVLLTTEEYEKLVKRFGKERVDKKIDYADSYFPNAKRKYNSHYYALNNWLKDNDADLKKEKKVGDNNDYAW